MVASVLSCSSDEPVIEDVLFASSLDVSLPAAILVLSETPSDASDQILELARRVVWSRRGTGVDLSEHFRFKVVVSGEPLFEVLQGGLACVEPGA